MSHIRKKPVLLLALLASLAWIGWAGLRPFEFNPPNRVAWIDGEAGLRFEGGGLALTKDEAVWNTTDGPARLELELELRPGPAPADTANHEVFVLFDEVPSPALVVYQTGTDLVVADRVTNPPGDRWYNDFRVADVFVPGERLRIRVIDGERPRILIDGEEAELTSGYAIPIGRAGEPVRGRLLLGALPGGQTPWTGELLGLAVKDGDTTIARYRFLEGEGTTVRNEVGPGLELELPPHFSSLRPPLALITGNTLDVLKNLLGFVPFGYVLARLLRGRARILLLVTSVGFVLSLTIELSQVLTLTRVSSLEDLVLNTLGTLAGAGLAKRLGTRSGPD